MIKYYFCNNLSLIVFVGVFIDIKLLEKREALNLKKINCPTAFCKWHYDLHSSCIGRNLNAKP